MIIWIGSPLLLPTIVNVSASLEWVRNSSLIERSKVGDIRLFAFVLVDPLSLFKILSGRFWWYAWNCIPSYLDSKLQISRCATFEIVIGFFKQSIKDYNWSKLLVIWHTCISVLQVFILFSVVASLLLEVLSQWLLKGWHRFLSFLFLSFFLFPLCLLQWFFFLYLSPWLTYRKFSRALLRNILA